MKISFTGTRKGMTFDQKKSFKQILVSSNGKSFIHGDCIGADADAHIIANNLGLQIVSEPEPPLVRNKKIVEDGTILVASPGEFVEEVRSGTWSTIRWARKQNKPIVIIWPDGQVQFENWQVLKTTK